MEKKAKYQDKKKEKKRNNEDKIKIIMSGLIIALVIILYSAFRCYFPKYIDILQIKLLNNIIDGWNVTHILFYGILAYIFPNEIYIIVLLGIIWEIIEYIMANIKFKNIFMSNIGGCKIREHDTKLTGRFKDIICNTIGIIIGYLIYYYINCKNKNE